MVPFRSILLLGAAALLPAQSLPEALDALPPDAAAYLLVRSPILTQAKAAGLMQRFGQGAEPDPLSALQTRFGLKRLPSDRRGLALMLEGADFQGAEPHPLLFLAVSDRKALVEALGAKPGEGGLHTYAAQGAPRVLAFREGWAVLGERSQAGAVRRAAQGPGGLRKEVGGLATWLEAKDCSALVTPQGLSTILHELRKDTAAGRAQARRGPDPLAQIEPVLARVQREVRFLGATADVDEHGNLVGVLRAQLHPQGTWATMSRDLELVSGPGLGDLRAPGYLMAMAGALPKAWSRAALDFQISLMGGPEGAPEAEGPREQALERLLPLIRGTRMLMPEGPGTPVQVVEVTDGEAYLREMDAFLTAMFQSSPKGPNPGGRPTLKPQRRRVEDHEALVLVLPPPPGDDLPPELRARLEAEATPFQTFLLRDPHTIEIRGGNGHLDTESAPVADLPALKAPMALLPRLAHLYAFANPRAFGLALDPAQAAQEARLEPGQRALLPPVPELPPFPGLGLALRLEPEAWELHLALPWELQLGLGIHLPARKKATEARTTALAKALAELPEPEPEEGEDDPED